MKSILNIWIAITSCDSDRVIVLPRHKLRQIYQKSSCKAEAGKKIAKNWKTESQEELLLMFTFYDVFQYFAIIFAVD